MESKSITKPGAKLITIYSGDLGEKSNYQDLGRYAEVDVAIAADAEATLPALIEACKRLVTADRKRAFAERARSWRRGETDQGRAIEQASMGGIPARSLRREFRRNSGIRSVMKTGRPICRRPVFQRLAGRLWDFEKHYHYIGAQGAYGIGYGAPAAAGAALANRNMAAERQHSMRWRSQLRPGVLWTAAHHHIPLLTSCTITAPIIRS